MDNDQLIEQARLLRMHTIKAIYNATSGHPGGCMSIADILAVLYFDEMTLDPAEPSGRERDRFVLSKGHACPALYVALAMRGFFPMEDAYSLRKLNGYLEGHPDVRIPGVDAVSGSLGMGLSQGIGMALGARHQGLNYRSYVLVGDGDLQEGNTWEGMMLAPFQKLDNIVVIYDANKLQGDAPVSEQLDMGDVSERARAFGWNVIDIDGHDIASIKEALTQARNTKGQPTFIHADTIKGKGVSFMENVLYWHGSVAIKDEELAGAMSELGA